MAIALSTSISGTLASGTTATITLPSYASTDYIVMFLSRNQTQASAFTFSAAITSITELAEAGTARRLIAMRLVPNGTGQTTFTLTGTTSGVWTWWIGAYSGVGSALTVASGTNTPGSNTTSTIEVPAVALGYIATGNEYGLSAGGVNATATWTTDANTLYNTGTAANAGLLVRKAAITAGQQTFVPGNLDRGLAGTTRSESAIAIVLQPTGNAPTINKLTNGSFETFTSGIATGWADEHALTGPFTYSSTTTGVVDGATAQRIQYTGQGTDNGTTSKGEIYQSSISASPGDVLDFSVYVSGTWANIYAIIGIEAFLTGGTYISETDASITSMTSTPTKYTVEYVCPPGTNYVAVYFQFPGIAPTTSWDVNLDNATLIKVGTGVIVPAAATGSGAALSPTVSGASSQGATVTAVLATGTATALPPDAVTGTQNPTVTAALATGTGAALAPTVTGTQSATVTATLATGTGTALAPVVTAGQVALIQPPTATGTATALNPVVTGTSSIIIVIPGPATGTWAAPTPAVSGGATTLAATATGTAQALAPAVTTAGGIPARDVTITIHGPLTYPLNIAGPVSYPHPILGPWSY